MTEPMFIPVGDLLPEIARTEPCSKCTGGLGVTATPPEEWNVVVGHSSTCPTLPELTRARMRRIETGAA
ncbi:hypothetical protein SAMN05216266_11013 [Amycolatopsis marina]|uniref:Uncharacterized protein n=1 Tax=Amycolatopsis marina TaxID=490629 RepID=A0A1I1AP43_9PSEU|nr:hypothetical protein [Amycolatopsis marina]SFB39727.1 hypothetical protein SAMN05216266_11013 [Amycolatopsis marina]